MDGFDFIQLTLKLKCSVFVDDGVILRYRVVQYADRKRKWRHAQ